MMVVCYTENVYVYGCFEFALNLLLIMFRKSLVYAKTYRHFPNLPSSLMMSYNLKTAQKYNPESRLKMSIQM